MGEVVMHVFLANVCIYNDLASGNWCYEVRTLTRL